MLLLLLKLLISRQFHQLKEKRALFEYFLKRTLSLPGVLNFFCHKRYSIVPKILWSLEWGTIYINELTCLLYGCLPGLTVNLCILSFSTSHRHWRFSSCTPAHSYFLLSMISSFINLASCVISVTIRRTWRKWRKKLWNSKYYEYPKKNNSSVRFSFLFIIGSSSFIRFVQYFWHTLEPRIKKNRKRFCVTHLYKIFLNLKVK